MIALFLGTSEGKKILSKINEFTQDVFVSTATEYGGELLKDYNYKILNTKPLTKAELEEVFINNDIKIVLDASHPYAKEISNNLIEITEKLNINYIRYERASVIEKYKHYEKLIIVKNYEELDKYRNIFQVLKGNILNTTGSRNIEKLVALNLNNRIIHRMLPVVSSVEKCKFLGIKIENILGIKGPISKEFEKSIIKEYNIDAVILKDSGIEGGTPDKLEAAIELDVYCFVIGRVQNEIKTNVLNNISDVVESISKLLN